MMMYKELLRQFDNFPWKSFIVRHEVCTNDQSIKLNELLQGGCFGKAEKADCPEGNGFLMRRRTCVSGFVFGHIIGVKSILVEVRLHT